MREPQLPLPHSSPQGRAPVLAKSNFTLQLPSPEQVWKGETELKTNRTIIPNTSDYQLSQKSHKLVFLIPGLFHSRVSHFALGDGDILVQSEDQSVGLPFPIKERKSSKIQKDMDSPRTSGCNSPTGGPIERALPEKPGNHSGVLGNRTPFFSVAPV